jgi:putative iron-regulated protein
VISRPSRPLLVLVIGALSACGSDRRPVVKQHAAMMYANLKDAVAHVQALQTAIDNFVASPTADTQAAAKQAWLDARPSYGAAEVGRFYKGPIDELQGNLNEWPIDESYIDYTQANPTGGIINNTQQVTEITQQTLDTYQGRAGAGNLALGFHAIEFLLWGQRLDQTQGPGQRPYTDYVDGGTAANQARRRTYLKLVTEHLLRDLTEVMVEWDLSDPMSYASKMVAGSPEDALTNIMRGQSSMAITELLYERLSDPYLTRDRKDEESCFSESTSLDLVANMAGIENVYLGGYNDVQGLGIADLVVALDPKLDATARQQLKDARAALEAMPQPFDHAVIAPDGSESRASVKAAIDAVTLLRPTFVSVAKALGITINL